METRTVHVKVIKSKITPHLACLIRTLAIAINSVKNDMALHISLSISLIKQPNTQSPKTCLDLGGALQMQMIEQVQKQCVMRSLATKGRAETMTFKCPFTLFAVCCNLGCYKKKPKQKNPPKKPAGATILSYGMF